ncbi:GNAT family N-acetyltransferase [Roseibium porphyridii]|uniref:GNAT family N-acetyltransferase n=1 Tax=Roseibium porphyridii TaxID=2866279 RepID=A0ABY8F5P0_9HYPH|nr:GNAT family N-acetyltransferase [Roseibium sp. KMA01]WFE90805.1 GNAT family N-acetyltransferase [Roseibium sp. KMA01]
MLSARISNESGDESAELADEIERQLLRSLRQHNIQSRNEAIVLKATSKDGQLLGGVTASTSYGWLLLKVLWVDEKARGSGLGSELLNAAETEGRRLDCHGAWLDTSNPQAYEFYLNRGYETFGTLENKASQHPANHCRWFMKKEL